MADSPQFDASDEPAVLRGLSPSQQERLTEILDDYLRRMESGSIPDRSELVAANPDLGEALEEYLSKLQELNQLVSGDAPSSEILGKQLGDFKLLRELGRGGMGVVYLAQQISLDRKVAVKLLPFASLLEPKYIERFKNEARAAAQLEHPNIVPVYAVGVEDNVHFYAMRYISGQSLDLVIASQRAEASAVKRDVSPRELSVLLQQFAEVAEALHRAHEYGIVHRDIKPSNLILDADKKLWLADFGLARFQTDRPITRTGEMIGTMRYMSPEQASGHGELVDHRTDIYSLGVTLYEALTLEPAVVGSEGPALLRMIEQESPIRLRRHCAALPIDVQTLVEKAMAKHRDDRYASADLFAQDLRRASSGYPILANRISPVVRVWRWAEKRRMLISAAVVVIFFAALGMAVSLYVINRERLLTESNKSDAQLFLSDAHRAVDELGSGFAEDLVGVPGAEQIRYRALRRTLDYYQRFAREVADDEELQLDLARTYSRIGALVEKLESSASAIQYYAKADEVYRKLNSDSSQPFDSQREYVENLNALGLALANVGQEEEARSAFVMALQIQSRNDQHAEGNHDRVDLGLTKNNFGMLLRQTGNLAEAEAAFNEAEQILRKAIEEQPEDFRAKRALGASLNNLGALQSRRDVKQATATLLKALDVQLPLAQESSHRLRASLDLVATYNNLASAHLKARVWPEAEVAAGRAEQISRQLIQIAPRIALYRDDLAVSLNSLGQALAAQNRFQAAVAAFREAIELQSTDGENAKNAEHSSNLGSTWNNLALVLEAQKDFESATTAFKKAVELQQRAISLTPENGVYRENLGNCLANLAQHLRQLDEIAEVLKIQRVRLELWKNDPVKLLVVADEIALLVTRFPEFVDELTQAVDLILAAGVKLEDLMKRPAFQRLPASLQQKLN